MIAPHSCLSTSPLLPALCQGRLLSSPAAALELCPHFLAAVILCLPSFLPSWPLALPSIPHTPSVVVFLKQKSLFPLLVLQDCFLLTYSPQHKHFSRYKVSLSSSPVNFSLFLSATHFFCFRIFSFTVEMTRRLKTLNKVAFTTWQSLWRRHE